MSRKPTLENLKIFNIIEGTEPLKATPSLNLQEVSQQQFEFSNLSKLHRRNLEMKIESKN